MGEPIWTNLTVRYPKRWGNEPWFVTALDEHFDIGENNMGEAPLDTLAAEFHGQLNYGMTSTNIGPIIDWLRENKVPYRQNEEGGLDWDPTWQLFDGINFYVGIGDQEPLLNASMYAMIKGGRHPDFPTCEDYFGAGNRDVTGELPAGVFDNLPAECPAQTEAVPTVW